MQLINRDMARVLRDYWLTYEGKRTTANASQSWVDLTNPLKMVETVIDLIQVMVSLDKRITGCHRCSTHDACVQVKWGTVTAHILVSMNNKNTANFRQNLGPIPKGSLVIAILPSRPSKDDCREAAQARLEGTNIVLACPDDVDALASALWSLSEMLYYKVLRVYLEGSVDVDAIFIQYKVNSFFENIPRRIAPQLLKLDAAIKQRMDNPREWVEHPRSMECFDALHSEENKLVLIEGPSASGKSTLALAVGKHSEDEGDLTYFLDVGELTEKQAFDVGASFFNKCIETTNEIAVILDDLQCQPKISHDLVSFFDLLAETFFAGKLHILATCWPNYTSEIVKNRPKTRVISIEASDINASLVQKWGASLEEKIKKQIQSIAGDDLLILRLGFDLAVKKQSSWDISTLGELVWTQRTKRFGADRPVLSRVVFIASLLGQYECPIPEGFLLKQADATQQHIHNLVRFKLLVRKGNKVTFVHRSFAKLLAEYLDTKEDVWNWLKKKWQVKDKNAIYGEIVLQYLYSVPKEIWAALQLMNRAGGIQISEKVQERTRFLAESWRSIGELLKKIYDQQKEDPTYNETPSSAAFACEALAAIGDSDAAKASVEFLRDHYKIKKGFLAVDVSRLSTLVDFEEISKETKKQDDELRVNHKTMAFERSDSLDIELFHKNWLCGIILSAEGAVQSIDPNTLKSIANAVLQRAHPDGYFYPSRVPWCTARVLIGLGSCGLNIKDTRVRKAADWLMKPREKGGTMENSHWEPWTGAWNSSVETTALCIIGLRKVGVPSDNQILNEATDWLFEEEQMSKLGRELDWALAIEAYILMGRDFNTMFFKKLRWLSEWAEGQALWRNVGKTAKETQEQSCNIVQTAAFLISAMWTILKADLPGLLKGLGITETAGFKYRQRGDKKQLKKALTPQLVSPKERFHGLEDVLKQNEPDLAVRYAVLAKDNDANDLLNDIQRIHPNYTSHGPDHSKNIIQIMGLLISTAKGEKLTPFEIYLLLCSAWLHDIGMSDFEGTYESVSTEEERKKLRSKIRRDHALRSRSYVCKDSNWKRLALEAYPIAALIGEVCKAHDRSVNISRIRREWPSIKGFEKYGSIRLQLLCALLRLADALDLGHQRVKEILITTCNVEEKYIDSLPHLRGGMLISRVKLEDNFIRVYAMPKSKREKSWVNMLVEDLVQDFRSVKRVLRDSRNKITFGYEGIKIETIMSSSDFSESSI